MAIVVDTKPITFGERTLMMGTYTASDVGVAGMLNLTALGFAEVNAVMHMGDSQTNINVKTAGNICLSNEITVNNAANNVSMNIWTPMMAVGNGGGKFMIIGRRGAT